MMNPVAFVVTKIQAEVRALTPIELFRVIMYAGIVGGIVGSVVAYVLYWLGVPSIFDMKVPY